MVSLKHSGSLILWSGGGRYYSKDSTDNAFKLVGEPLLRQHFDRAWFDVDSQKKGQSMHGTNFPRYGTQFNPSDLNTNMMA